MSTQGTLTTVACTFSPFVFNPVVTSPSAIRGNSTSPPALHHVQNELCGN